MNRPVVVGYDGSAAAEIAVETALYEARLREAPLVLLHAAVFPIPAAPLGSFPDVPERDRVLAAIGEELSRLRSDLQEKAPELEIQTEVVDTFNSAGVLVDRSRTAELLVVGSRGRGGFAGLLLGSTSAQLATHAHCPVIVTRTDAATDAHEGKVVVGVDGTKASMPAVEFAFRAASLRKVPLVAVHAWRYPVSSGPGDMVLPVYEPGRLAHEEEAVLAECLAGCKSEYPEVELSQRTVRGQTRGV